MIELYWLPLGRWVRWNGRAYEALAARRAHRPRCELYHSALIVDGYAIEMAPVWSDPTPDRGVIAEGPVGSRWLGRSRWFRYEIRCRRDGRIPDLAEAVESPQRLSGDAQRLLALVRELPTPVWGRDDLRLGEMWNSNSVIAWLLARDGLDPRPRLPAGGRAPGWGAGLALANRAITR